MGFLRCGRRLPQRLLDRTPLPQWCNRRSGYGHPRKFPLLSPPLPALSSPSSPSFLRSMTTQTESRQAPAAAAAAPAVAPVGGLVVPPLSPEDSLEVFVDGHSVRVPKGLTVLQACEVAGVDIPRFCYHPRLSVAGNCRMCLVEVEKTPKPVASCAMPALPGMKIKTNTPLVKKAREGVMEFLLVNHPLDCPICDQGGECDLQDQSMAFGSDRGRYTEPKRSVVDKNLGPLVKTIMTRCIQCTRCVRFATEIAGVEDLGVLGRGSGEEIGTYVENTMKSELSGNVIDICPVGALTSRPYAFTSRPWELKRTESVDVSDAVGANIRIDSRGPEVMRIIPRLNEDVNEEWLSDKARFCYDGLKRQRLNEPLIRHESGHLEPATWQKALEAVAAAVKKVGGGEQMAGIAGKLSDVEGMMALKDFLNKLGCESLWCEGNGSGSIADLRSNYLLNTSIAGLENADLFLLVGTQVRVEAPLVNLRIRKAVRGSNAKVAAIGAPMDLTYPHTHLGSGTEALVQIAEGRHPFCGELLKAKNPVVIVGASLFEREDQDAVMSAVRKIVEQGKVVRDDWNGFNVLHLNAANAGALELGFVPGIGATSSLKNVKFLYLLGADDVVLDDLPEDAFVVYQGHHGDQGVYRANVILPSPAYSEKEATYVNTEGRVQQTSPAVPTISDARDDWKIVRAISEMVGAKLPYDSVNELRGRMLAVSPNLFRVDRLEPACAWPPALNPAPKTEISVSPFEKAIKNFYMTNSICRASGTMAKCTSAYVHNEA